MTGPRLVGALITAAILCYTTEAGASPGTAEPEPPAPAAPVASAPVALRLLTPATCTTAGGSALSLDPGRYLPEPLWLELDGEVRRLQDHETRLAAENAALRKAPVQGRSRWVLAGLTLSAGIAIGIAASR